MSGLVTPDAEKFDLKGRLERAYAKCRALADVVDGEPAFHVRVIASMPDYDPAQHEYLADWEARVGAFYFGGRTLVGVRFAVRKDATERLVKLLEGAATEVFKAYGAASSRA
jgi:hypothetical protein